METITRRQALLKAIYEKLEQAYEDTLEDVIELLDIRASEDEGGLTKRPVMDRRGHGNVSLPRHGDDVRSHSRTAHSVHDKDDGFWCRCAPHIHTYM